jgi:hypothetical protein
MELGAWLGTAEPRPVDALALIVLSDALFPTRLHSLRATDRRDYGQPHRLLPQAPAPR